MRKIADLALAGTNVTKAITLFMAMLPCTLVCSMIGGATALADSKSSAEFTLATCLPAMDDLARVEVLAKENNWTDKTPANAGGKFIKSLSMWEVMQGEDKFTLQIWVNQLENFSPLNVCGILFAGMNVKREEFFDFISASVELELKSDTQIQTRNELYEIKRHGVARERFTVGKVSMSVGLYINFLSRSDGTLMGAVLSEMPKILPRARN
jgi:hypothetical protein